MNTDAGLTSLAADTVELRRLVERTESLAVEFQRVKDDVLVEERSSRLDSLFREWETANDTVSDYVQCLQIAQAEEPK